MTTPIQLLVLSRYDRRGASSRLRTFQYAPYLALEGVAARWQPFFDDDYLGALYEGRRVGFANAGYLLRRLATLHRPRADAVWVEKEALPWLPAALELRMIGAGIPLIVDYDDAVFHRYDRHRLLPVRALLGGKIDAVMRRADLVIAGNPYLAARAKSAGAANIAVVPTVIDIRRYRMAPPPAEPVIGWIGTPSTWAAYMLPMLPLLEQLHNTTGATIRAVGAPKSVPPTRGLTRVTWNETTEVAELQNMSVGIMPMSDTPWSQGKCAYKLIQYMACGLPVVASPVGMNRAVIEHGVNGFFAEHPEEWRNYLTRLLSNPEERARLGAAGRKKVESTFVLNRTGPLLAELIARTVRDRLAQATPHATGDRPPVPAMRQ